MNYILVHYDEIGLKGKNRPTFENKLVENIKSKAKTYGIHKTGTVKKVYGRILIALHDESNDTKDAWHEVLSTTFGIANFAFATLAPLALPAINAAAVEAVRDATGESFRITARRSNKDFPHPSQEIARSAGAAVVDELGKTVNLSHPDITCFIDVTQDGALVYSNKTQGPGGLPSGVGGSAIILMSGGIDSPVAAWYVAKRGLTPIFLHFHSYPFTKKNSIDKVRELSQIVARYSGESTLYLDAFAETQREIMMQAPDKFRILLYRRFMYRIADALAKQLGAKALVTGEALGQVASQTIENMTLTNAVTDTPILRPLVGFDKREIITKAKEIGSYETSILPHEDCCTLFTPKNPETRGKAPDIADAEQTLDIPHLVDQNLAALETEQVYTKNGHL